jgi:hypothetical protein
MLQFIDIGLIMHGRTMGFRWSLIYIKSWPIQMEKNILKRAQLGRSVHRKTRMSTNLIVLLTTVGLDRNFDP